MKGCSVIVEAMAECDKCQGTGISHGSFEPGGVGVLCWKCGGTGGVRVMYTPFDGVRKRRDDIHTVWPRSDFLDDPDRSVRSQAVPYEEFLASTR